MSDTIEKAVWSMRHPLKSRIICRCGIEADLWYEAGTWGQDFVCPACAAIYRLRPDRKLEFVGHWVNMPRSAQA